MFNFFEIVRHWWNCKSNVLDAIKVDTPNFTLWYECKNILWYEKMVPYFSCSIDILQNFTACIQTEHGTFLVENPKVFRNRVTGTIDIIWPFVNVLKTTGELGIYIYDEYGNCIAKNTHPSICTWPGDIIRPSYSLTV